MFNFSTSKSSKIASFLIEVDWSHDVVCHIKGLACAKMLLLQYIDTSEKFRDDFWLQIISALEMFIFVDFQNRFEGQQ